MQALTHFCDNINIPDSLCELLLPNVNHVIVCEPRVNLWAFRAVAGQWWQCCPFPKHLPAGMAPLTAGGWHGKQLSPNLPGDGSLPDERHQVKRARGSVSRPSFLGSLIPAQRRAHGWVIIPHPTCCAPAAPGYAHALLCVEPKAGEDKSGMFPAKQQSRLHVLK